jgi:Trypsin-co-occurring domain 1
VGEILVEVRPAYVSGDIARRVPAVPESFASRAGEVADTITDVAAGLRDHLEANMAEKESHLWRLTTVELGFELTLQAEAGVIIARASTEATFSVTLTWSKGDAI